MTEHRPATTDGEPMARLVGVGKRYVKYQDAPTLISGVMRLGKRSRRGRLWAVRGVDLEVAPGETVGIIGRNGSGKSTLLGMLAGVTAPTEGSVAVRGRVAPLISVGVGFDPELTGQENVYVNGSILGLSRREIERLFDSIVEFAEIEDFIDTPVKFYSSGMFVRLGFSVAVAARPDLLLVDEVLAVGDVAFQRKCFERMTEMQDQGTALVVVTHNLAAVRNLCDRVLLLHDGTPRFEGPTDEAISLFHEFLQQGTVQEGGVEKDVPVRVEGFDVLGPDGTSTSYLRAEEEATFRLHVRFLRRVDAPHFGFRLTTQSGQIVYADGTYASGATRSFEAGEEATWEARLRLPLVTGTYTAFWGVQFGKEPEHSVGAGPRTFYLSGRPMVKGYVDLEATFDLRGGPAGSPGMPG